MKVRIISSLCALPLLFYSLCFAPQPVMVAIISLVTVAATLEMLTSTNILRDKGLLLLCCGFSALLPVWTAVDNKITPAAGVFFITAAVFTVAILSRREYTFERVCAIFFATFIIPLFMAAILRIRLSENGIYLSIIPFAASWLCDSGAYFTGRFLGRHKLVPEISPKKTWEGAVGGLAAGTLGTILLAFVYQRFFGKTPDYVFFAVAGALGAIVAQLGDLSFSFIKRNYNIKDYGAVMPGHGGVLDRFDSVLFAAPLVEFLIHIFPNQM